MRHQSDGAESSSSLLHLVERSITAEIRLDRLAEAAGYRTVAAVTAADEITQAVRTALDSPGPALVEVGRNLSR